MIKGLTWSPGQVLQDRTCLFSRSLTNTIKVLREIKFTQTQGKKNARHATGKLRIDLAIIESSNGRKIHLVRIRIDLNNEIEVIIDLVEMINFNRNVSFKHLPLKIACKIEDVSLSLD